MPVLRPLISPNNTINVNPGNNSLVITDYADNLQRLARIVAAMDVSNATDVEVIPLRNAIAADLVPLVSRLIDGGSNGAAPTAVQGQTDNAFKTTLLAEPRSNSLILRAANPARVAWCVRWCEKLDQPPGTRQQRPPPATSTWCTCRMPTPPKLAATLRAALNVGNPGAGGDVGGGARRAPPAGMARPRRAAPTGGTGHQGGPARGIGWAAAPAAVPQVWALARLGGWSRQQQYQQQPASTGGQIQADPTTNSLIISAPETPVPPAARRDRQAGRPPRAGAGGEPDRGSVGQQARGVRHSVARHHRCR